MNDVWWTVRDVRATRSSSSSPSLLIMTEAPRHGSSLMRRARARRVERYCDSIAVSRRHSSLPGVEIPRSDPFERLFTGRDTGRPVGDLLASAPVGSRTSRCPYGARRGGCSMARLRVAGEKKKEGRGAGRPARSRSRPRSSTCRWLLQAVVGGVEARARRASGCADGSTARGIDRSHQARGDHLWGWRQPPTDAGLLEHCPDVHHLRPESGSGASTVAVPPGTAVIDRSEVGVPPSPL